MKPNVVLIAKSAYVWLDQLSRWYERPVNRLDEVPDEELDRLARWGFSGLWLIGLWQRAPASRNLKQFLGNPTAEAAAYSLHDYRIAADLGNGMAASLVLISAYAKLTGLVSLESLVKAMEQSVPSYRRQQETRLL